MSALASIGDEITRYETAALCQEETSDSTGRTCETYRLRHIATAHFFNWNLKFVPCFLLKSA